MPRLSRSLLSLCLAGAALLLPALPAGTGPNPPRLPDLVIDREILSDYRISYGSRTRLRFDTAIVNVGAGPLEMRGARRNRRQPMLGQQIIYGERGGKQQVALGEWEYHDEHSHWHVLNVAEYRLLDSRGNPVGEVKKVSYCLVDNRRLYPRLARSPRSRQYRGCSTSRRALKLRTGISVGWADIYDRSVYDQWIDITDVPPGDYTLVNVANPLGTLMESDTSNNTTTVPVRIPPRS